MLLSNNRLSLLIAFITLIVCFPLRSQEFVIGVEDVPYYPLFDFHQEEATFTTELLDQFARNKGYTFRYLPLPIKRFHKWLVDEDIDFKYPDNERWLGNKTNPENLVFSDSTLRLVGGTLVLPKHLDRKVSEMKVIGTLLGFYPTLWIDELNAGKVTIYENSSTMVLIQQALREQIDGLTLDPAVVEYHLQRLGRGGELVINTNYRHQLYDYHLSTIKHADIIAQFNVFLKQNQDFIQSLHKKYQLTDYRQYGEKLTNLVEHSANK